MSLVGLRQCTKDDVEEHTLHIELADSQIALRGIESRGYVILSATNALVDQYRHKPVWRDQQLCDKTSWHVDLQGMRQQFHRLLPRQILQLKTLILYRRFCCHRTMTLSGFHDVIFAMKIHSWVNRHEVLWAVSQQTMDVAISNCNVLSRNQMLLYPMYSIRNKHSKKKRQTQILLFR